MKTLIVYYSLSGNTEYIANHISKKINANTLKLKPVKEIPTKGIKKFYYGGKSAVMKKTPALENYDLNLDEYNHVIFGTPIWAGTFTPPLRTFIQENKDKLKNKNISAFFCNSGGGAKKAIIKLKKFLEIENFQSELELINPLVKNEEDQIEELERFIKELEM